MPPELPAGACLPPGWFGEEKMLNAAKIIVYDTAGRNWERQHAAGTACRRMPAARNFFFIVFTVFSYSANRLVKKAIMMYNCVEST